KLPDEEEHAIEQEIFALLEKRVEPVSAALVSDTALAQRYLDNLLSTTRESLGGIRLVIDCGNGASYRLAPELFREAGAEVETICSEPNGRNINLNCGALHLEALQKKVISSSATFGVAFDGDADRAIFVSSAGNVINGDGVLLAAGCALKAEGRLPGN